MYITFCLLLLTSGGGVGFKPQTRSKVRFFIYFTLAIVGGIREGWLNKCLLPHLINCVIETYFWGGEGSEGLAQKIY